MQNGQVVVYVSRQSKPHKENDLTHDFELVVVVFALKVCRCYLYGVHFEIFNDQNSLKYLFDQKKLNMWWRRWMEYLKNFDFELNYHSSKENKVADELSRK